jgi:class 3 adenylate cyclase
VKRRLTTILATDAVGYSRLMSESEEETARVLAAHRAVIDGIIQFHDGRIFDTAGDSVLAEFGSPVQAVRCAVEIQDALKTRNDSLPENRRMMFRIGINLGDVMVKGNDLLGDGINVAARLESIAEPGGICIASSVYDQISGKLNLQLTDIGEQALKNITRPIRAYRIQSTGLPQTPRPAPARKKGRRPWLAAAGLALLAAAAGAVYWQQRDAPQAPPVPDQAALARDKAAADAQRLRDEAQAVRRKAEADAAKIRAEAEADRAKAEADAMRAKAKADADAMRAKAKAETDAARIKAEAAAAAAKERQEAARAAAKAPPVQVASIKPPAGDTARFDGSWRLNLSCPQAEGFSARESETIATITAGTIVARFGVDGNPGYFNMRGTLERDDALVLQGNGIGGGRHRGKEFIIYIPGRFEAGGYRGEGKFGGRHCVVTLAR